VIYGDDLELLKDQIDSGAHNVALEGSAQHEFFGSSRESMGKNGHGIV